MPDMRTFTIAALAASVAADAGKYHPRPIFAPIPELARRGNECSELPKLCTDPVMFYGKMTTMTYLCPGKTNGIVTVTVTTTGTTTVTEIPTDGVFPTFLSSMATVSVSDEPTTTISTTSTVKTTVKITVTKHIDKVAESLIPAPFTDEFTAVLPSNAMLTPAPITNEYTAAQPSLTPAPFTDEFTAVLPNPPQAGPVDISVEGSTSFNLFPSHSVTSSSVMSSSSVTSSPSAGYAVPVVSALLYLNTTTHNVHDPHKYTKNAREADPTETAESATATPSSKGMAGETRVSFVALFVGLMAAAFIL